MRHIELAVWVVALLLLVLLAAAAKADGARASMWIFTAAAALAAGQVCISFSALQNQ